MYWRRIKMWSVIMGYLALFMLTPMLSNYVIELSRNPGEIAIRWDAKCFPIAHKKGEKQTVVYEDSWGNERTYGGKRTHEGTDIMSSNNVRGYFPIVSVSDGVVEKKGWLKLGGYRLGIRSSHGVYFYYAHLERYEKGIEEGSRVKAGQIIGYMGDSGYGKEGTVGKFPVHLHFGIYIKKDGKEVSVNPYPILKSIDDFTNASSHE